MLGFFRKNKNITKEVLAEDFFLDFWANKEKKQKEENRNRRGKQDSACSAIEVALAQKNFVITLSIFGVILIFFLATCFYYQFFAHGYYAEKAERNKYVSSEIDAQRGIIYDSRMQQVAFNSNSFDLVYKKNAEIDANEMDREVFELAKIFGKSGDEIKNILKEKEEKFGNKDEFIVFDDLEKEKTIILKTKIDDFKLFYIKKNRERQYANPIAYSHLLGYFSKESNEGSWGIEKQYDEYLKEIPGIFNKERNAKGVLVTEELIKPSESGKNLVLNIDKGTQEKVSEIIKSVVEKYGAKSGTAIIADVNTGGIISMVTWPSFDANMLSKGLSTEEYNKMVGENNFSFFNRAISGEYALGSTVKPVMAIAGLEENLVKASDVVGCQGRISLPGGGFKNDWTTHGATDLKKAMAESCDVYFYILGGGYGVKEGLGSERMKKYFNDFGYGKETGIDISGEKAGLIPDSNWKNEQYGSIWYSGDDYNMSIGQGYFKATPLQLTMATAAIANGGRLMKPEIVKAVLDSDGKEVKKIEPEVIRTVSASSEHLSQVREAMRETVLSPRGTARGLQLMPVTSAAKTGTAQTSKADVYHNLITIFAPYEKPEVSITVIIESAPYEMNAANYASREIISYYFGERLKKEKEALDRVEKEKSLDLENEITAPDGADETSTRVDVVPEEGALPKEQARGEAEGVPPK